MPLRRLTVDGHGQEFGAGREAVLCVVFHERMFVQVGVDNDVALRETNLCIETDCSGSICSLLNVMGLYLDVTLN